MEKRRMWLGGGIWKEGEMKLTAAKQEHDSNCHKLSEKLCKQLNFCLEAIKTCIMINLSPIKTCRQQLKLVAKQLKLVANSACRQAMETCRETDWQSPNSVAKRWQCQIKTVARSNCRQTC
jgi:hypothetical protein